MEASVVKGEEEVANGDDEVGCDLLVAGCDCANIFVDSDEEASGGATAVGFSNGLQQSHFDDNSANIFSSDPWDYSNSTTTY